MAKKRLKVIFTGRLNQVDFREHAFDYAAAHKVTGYIKKLDEARAMLVVEGEEEEIKNFLHDFNEYMDIFIDNYTKTWLPATGEYTRFRILKV